MKNQETDGYRRDKRPEIEKHKNIKSEISIDANTPLPNVPGDDSKLATFTPDIHHFLEAFDLRLPRYLTI